MPIIIGLSKNSGPFTTNDYVWKLGTMTRAMDRRNPNPVPRKRVIDLVSLSHRGPKGQANGKRGKEGRVDWGAIRKTETKGISGNIAIKPPKPFDVLSGEVKACKTTTTEFRPKKRFAKGQS